MGVGPGSEGTDFLRSRNAGRRELTWPGAMLALAGGFISDRMAVLVAKNIEEVESR